MLATNHQTNNHYPTNHDNQIKLINGYLLLNKNLAALVLGDKLIQTWPINGWSFLEISIDEKYAIFEANDSWLLATLDLQTGTWSADTDILFPSLSLEEDACGEYIYNHDSKERIYLKPELKA